jgi:hypothetical protein
LAASRSVFAVRASLAASRSVFAVRANSAVFRSVFAARGSLVVSHYNYLAVVRQSKVCVSEPAKKGAHLLMRVVDVNISISDIP